MLIFVSIASYRDPELVETIKSVIKNATHREDITFGICQQDLPKNYITSSRQIKIKYFLPEESNGVGWARSIANAMYNNEDYFLQIDSHTEMIPGWDDVLINQYKLASQTTSRALIMASYPATYELDANKKRILSSPGTNRTKIKFIADSIILEGECIGPVTGGHPIKSYYVNTGFMFGHGSFMSRVRPDPRIYFWGEEIATTVRAFTYGFDLFHPADHVCWHHYYRKGNPHYWDAEDDIKRTVKWPQRDAESRAIVTKLLMGQLDDEYGLGSERSLEEFETYAGVSFKKRILG